MTETNVRDEFEPLPADWDKYRDNNHHEMPLVRMRFGGGVCFRRHLNKPLSQRLWEDLLYRFGITGLCVYGPNDAEWTIGWRAGHCNIRLDEAGNVRDIEYYPK